ncbi:MAG TPA: hypothetical protein VNV42_16125 [Solirubrobacteraceae bacterium]|jgi:hypothetical protein|nr:hypothetical protein [Solirubrobacteraceae bacterium]
MGLLDDAIREHFELRRRHGADPSEVMSKEQEAFGAEADRDGGLSGVEADTLFAASRPSTMLAEDRRPKRERMRAGDDDGLGQPTVELDMQAVLDEESTRARLGYGAIDASPAGAGAEPVRALR